MTRKEQFEAIENCKNPEEVMQLAKTQGETLTPGQAKRYFELVHSAKSPLTDQELDAVTGGCGEVPNPIDYYNGFARVPDVDAWSCDDEWKCKHCDGLTISWKSKGSDGDTVCSIHLGCNPSIKISCRTCRFLDKMDGIDICKNQPLP